MKLRPPRLRFRLRISPALVGVLATGLTLLTCSTASEKEAFVRRILAERADHLSTPVRHRMARTLMDLEGADPLLVLAVVEEESRFRPDARSHRGALGLMQILPATGEETASKMGIPWEGPDTLQDPELNLRIGARYLTDMEERYGSWELALAAYHRGPQRLDRGLSGEGPFRSGYSSRVLQRYAGLQEDLRRHR